MSFGSMQRLIIEEDISNMFALTSILKARGAIIQVARNGMDGLEALQTSLDGGEQPIDLVLMDIMMPKMDGLTTIRKIRQQSASKDIRIIALMAKARQIDDDETLTPGANDTIVKASATSRATHL